MKKRKLTLQGLVFCCVFFRAPVQTWANDGTHLLLTVCPSVSIETFGYYRISLRDKLREGGGSCRSPSRIGGEILPRRAGPPRFRAQSFLMQPLWRRRTEALHPRRRFGRIIAA